MVESNRKQPGKDKKTDMPFIRLRNDAEANEADQEIDGVPVDLNRPSDLQSPLQPYAAHGLLHNVDFRMASRKFFCETCQKEFTAMVNLNALDLNLPRCAHCNG